MPDVRYVCISDMHLGEEDSLLTRLKPNSGQVDPLAPSKVMEQLVECLKYLISKNDKAQKKKPTLILNGDILEMALATTNQAAMVFERFIELIMPTDPQERLFDAVFYIPGNHDHHIWELARETQYVDYIPQIDWGDELPEPWHTTNMFVENDRTLVRSQLLTGLIQRCPHLKKAFIRTAYPNFGLISRNGKKCVIFHHGHYIEPLYQLVSMSMDLIFPGRQMPRHIWDIEAENFAWIDFFWSTLGQSGGAGEKVELIYEKSQDTEELTELIYSLARELAKRYEVPLIRSKICAKFLKYLIRRGVKKCKGMEKMRTDSPLSKEADEGLSVYMNRPVRGQIQIERQANMPCDVTFVFGHTHKPFERAKDFDAYPKWVNVYNSGGWVVESQKPESVRGGAVVLVDENLDAVSLRMYNEADTSADYAVRVEEAKHVGERNSAFCERIRKLVKASKQPWKSFSVAVAESIDVRRKYLKARIRR
jgi:hypothetical protein